jgi:hypothetical protein
LTKTNLGDKADRLIAIVGGLVALVASVQQGRPTSAIILLALGYVLSGLLIRRLWSKGSGRATRITRRRKLVAAALAVGLVTTSALVAVLPGGRSLVKYGILGFKNKAAPGLEIAQTGDSYRLRVPLYNDAEDGQLSTVRVGIEVTEMPGICQPVPEAQPAAYQLSDHVELYEGPRRGTFYLAGQLIDNGGWALQASGEVTLPTPSPGATAVRVRQCYHGSLQFVFEPQMPLPGRTTTMLDIGVPKILHATGLDDGFGQQLPLPGPSKVRNLEVPLAPPGVSALATSILPGWRVVLHVIGSANDGHEVINVCDELVGVPSQLGQAAC